MIILNLNSASALSVNLNTALNISDNLCLCTHASLK